MILVGESMEANHIVGNFDNLTPILISCSVSWVLVKSNLVSEVGDHHDALSDHMGGFCFLGT